MFKAFHEEHCPKLGSFVPWFRLNQVHIKYPYLQHHHDFWEEKKSNMALNLVSREGTESTVILLLARNSSSKQNVEMYSHGGETNHQILLFRMFSAHTFLQKPQCVNVIMLVYNLPLRNKFMMHSPMNVTKKHTQNERLFTFGCRWTCLDTLPSTPLSGTGMTGACTETAAWFLGCTCKFTSHRPQLPLNGIWHLSKPLLMFLSFADTILLLLLTQQVWHKFGSNQVHVQVAFKNDLNWTKWNSQNIMNFKDSNSSVFEDQFFHTISIFIWSTC